MWLKQPFGVAQIWSQSPGAEMGSIFPELNERLQEFIAQQKMFFVASAPLAANGHINVSPKGLDCLRILGPTTIAYIDFTGSGIETVAHLRENGRLTLMFCAFQGPPRILRLRGRGEAIEPNGTTISAKCRNMPARDRSSCCTSR
jgi:Pyridoxamine 5'-phosphate oxidase